MDSEVKRNFGIEYKELYKKNLVLIVIFTLAIFALCFAAFISYSVATAPYFGILIDLPTACLWGITFFYVFRDSKTTSEKIQKYKLFPFLVVVYMFIFSFIVLASFAAYYDENYQDCDYGYWRYCCWNCEWSEDDTVDNIIGSVFSLLASVLSGLLLLFYIILSKKISQAEQSPHLIDREHQYNQQQQQTYQQPAYQQPYGFQQPVYLQPGQQYGNQQQPQQYTQPQWQQQPQTEQTTNQGDKSQNSQKP